ncbi:hypothetical protein C1141_15365 [Vibrio agarivorans]|uniref:Uncharacterized protein n=1 Tax=Vibrio sagamiensis NBRC 104589 TaxID=1219064 RepID=A0A511QIK5_9VIBR|nr:hypothetical protein C1141_15365 [Vibrio agarivorans]GEM76946.1 hypothetical protein VSA01S_30580 [Vibrio sagamiensis NBRC 104589]
MFFELETKLDGYDKVRHAQIKIDDLMSASTKTSRYVYKQVAFNFKINPLISDLHDCSYGEYY